MNDTFNYQGFIEGDGIFQGIADVIVCDGFSGNVALKAGEGVARHIYQKLSELPAENSRGLLILHHQFSRRYSMVLTCWVLMALC